MLIEFVLFPLNLFCYVVLGPWDLSQGLRHSIVIILGHINVQIHGLWIICYVLLCVRDIFLYMVRILLILYVSGRLQVN